MKTRRISITAAAALAGFAAAVALTLPATASAYTPDQLPGLGYQVTELNLGSNCHDWQAAGYGASADLGSDCDPGFQAALDAFVQATYPPLQTTTTTATTTTDATQTTTTTTTADTTTTAPVAAPAPAPPTTTTTTTAPPTTTCDVQCQLADLQAQIDAIRGELVQLIQILEQWPGIDPGILSQLMALGS